MAGVSSESLTRALTDLEARLPAATLSLADDLFSILGTVDGSAALRRALTDPSRDAYDKTAVVAGLFHGKVSAQAEAITAGLVSLRWAAPRDLADALEVLAATVVIAVAENLGPERLEVLENELFSFNHAVESSHELQAALAEPQASADAKATLALKLVPLISQEASVLIRQAVTAPRGLKPTVLVRKFVELVARRQQRWIANVSVTRPLTQSQMARLQAGLNRVYGRELKINTNVDKALVGGIRVQVGDEVVDASVISQLSDLRRKLAG